MNSKNIQSGKSFYARVYKINKGKNSQHAYFATIRKEEIQRLSITEKDAVLLNILDQMFPAVIRKLKTSGNRFMLGFTVPFIIGENLQLKTDLIFNLLKKNTIFKEPIKRKDKLNLQEIISVKTIRNYPIYLFDFGENLMMWIYSKGNKPYILPKHVPIENNHYNLFEFAGAFFCEGFKARKKNKHRDRFSFSNADPEQVAFFLNASEKLLNIPKKEWKAQILHPNFNQISNLTKLWSKLGVSKERIKIIENKTVLAKQGVCILYITNSTLAEIICILIKYLEKESLKSKENALNFFRGLSRGDLGVSHKDRSIKFSTESKKNAIFFRKLCNVLEIPTNKIYHNKKGINGYWGSNVSISYTLLTKLIEMNAITHSKRKARLQDIIANTKRKTLNQKV